MVVYPAERLDQGANEQSMNTSEFLMISAAIVPDRTAVIFEDRRVTFQEMQARANRLSNALAGAGVVSGDRVAILEVNTDRYV